ncbi:glycosyltransferase [Streptomyces sp. NPDC048362]|uniref:glycosyltransferase n=1 Tax=Streptomyces sp. NPDC048362 TaxID=3365539 RepID=UPI00371B03A2
MVALVSDDGAFGGPTSVALSQLQEFATRGHQVELLSLWRGRASAPPSSNSVRLVTRPARRFVPGRSCLGLMNPLLLRDLWKSVGQADMVHVHAGRDLVSLTALIVARLRRKPFVTQTHGMVEPRTHMVARIFDTLYVPLLRRARCNFVLTAREKQGLERVLGPRRSKLITLPNGVSATEEFNRLPRHPHEVIFLARLHERKRPTVFVQMAALVHEKLPDVRFIMYGPDEGALDKVLSHVETLGLTKVVRYAGPLAPSEVHQAYRNAAVYVLPSVDEPFPMTILEALAAGLAVVCTDSCGIAKTLAHREAAVVTDGSPEALASAVVKLLADQDLYDRVTDGARRTLQECFSIQAVVDRLEATYAEFAAKL